MIKAATLILVSLVALPTSAAPIVIATGGTRDEVQAAVDALGGPGVVVIPPGDWETAGTVTIAADDVTILGCGHLNTHLHRGAADASTTDGRDAAFFAGTGIARLRISGLDLAGVTAAASAALEKGVQLRDAVDFRVDHCRLGYLGHSGVLTTTSRGVVDHCVIHDGFKPAIGNYGYGVTVMGGCTYTGLPWDTAEATFIEDCTVSGARHATASNAGARYVFRHSRVTANENSHGADAHGDEYNGSCGHGTEWIAVHDVVFDDPVYSNAAVRIRGGAGLVYANTVNGYANAVSLWESTPQPTGWVYIWGNTLSAGTTLVNPATSDTNLDADGSPAFKKNAPTGFAGTYTYPHPLVTDLVAAAGPDQRAAGETGVPTDVPAAVFVDATGTTAATGAVAAYRWYDGTTLVSTCARDVLSLAPGEHILVLEAERDDGAVEHDTAVVRVTEPGPLVSTSSWADRWFVPLVSGTATVRFTMTPSAAPQDAYVALAGRHAVTDHEDSAILIRTNSTGHLDVRNGGAYAADATIAYAAGTPLHVVVTIDLAAQTYSVTVDGQALATGYAFRRAEATLDQMIAWHSSGGLTASDLVVEGPRAEADLACRAAPAPDAGPVDAPTESVDGGGGTDGGSPGIMEGGGCGCRASGPGGGNAAALLAIALLSLACRRRRQG